MGHTNPIKNPAFPLLVGLDHNDKGLIPKAEEVIGRFGEKGKTFFVEGTSGTPPRKSSDYGYGPFDAAAMKAAENGMTVIKLDRPLFKGIKQGLPSTEDRYVTYDVRERQWVRTVRKEAKGGDLVMVHQEHLVRLLRKLRCLVLVRMFGLFQSPNGYCESGALFLKGRLESSRRLALPEGR